MKISKVEIRRLPLPMVRSFAASFGVIKDKETVIVKLYTEDGLVGYGESSSIQAPVYNHETVETCFYTQKNFIAPLIVNREFDTVEEFRSAYRSVVGNPIARAGVECAFWHLLAQRDNVSLKKLFGGVKDEIPVGEGVGVKAAIGTTLQEVDKLVSEGYQRIKVKVMPDQDINVLEAIRRQFPHIQISIDGNGSYDLNRDKVVLRSLDKLNLAMIEQPFRSDDYCGHAELQKQIKTPICLDESIESLNDAKTAVALGACKAINIKPGRVGGIAESIAIHDYAMQHGIGVWCGGMGETGIGRAFNIAFASKENCRYPADMSPFHYFYQEDIVKDSFGVKPNGCIDVRDKPGLGYEIDDAAIERFTVDMTIVNQ